MKKSFTMMELVFVIVIIGILSAIALPKLWVTRDDAAVAKLRADVSSIRSSISNKYGKNILSGSDSCPPLESDPNNNKLFDGILTYPITKNTGAVKWDGNGTDYNATVTNTIVKFHYYNNSTDNCKFGCEDNCDLIGE
ncbi:type II secretion system protein [Nautilia sp.]